MNRSESDTRMRGVKVEYWEDDMRTMVKPAGGIQRPGKNCGNCRFAPSFSWGWYNESLVNGHDVV